MSLKVRVVTGDPRRLATEVVVIPVTRQGEVAVTLPRPLAEAVKRLMKERSFRGEWGSATLFVRPVGGKNILVAVAGLGDMAEHDRAQMAEGLRRGIGHIVHEARRHGVREIAVVLSGLAETPALAGAVAEAAQLSNYFFAEYSRRLQDRQRRQELRQVLIVVDADQQRESRRHVRDAQVVAEGVVLARDLVNRPADAMSPEALVAAARELASDSATTSVKVLNRRQAEKEGFTAFLAVARGSTVEPYVIHLTYRPKDKKAAKKLVLVGKGVTFDSGGLSLKPADYMENMKADMAGAATVLGVFSALEALKPPIEVHGIIAACENMPSGTAYRPGDVVTSRNGTTIEVLNTDAEGRITLADALSYAVDLKPDAIVDVATLTGAAMVGLGETVAGMWSSDDTLSQQLYAAGKEAGEQYALLPMPDEYKPLLESQVADLRNVASSRYGGAITAAMFLREFVGDVPWVHLDMAGPSYLDRPYVSYHGKGATGFGVRTLLKLVSSL